MNLNIWLSFIFVLTQIHLSTQLLKNKIKIFSIYLMVDINFESFRKKIHWIKEEQKGKKKISAWFEFLSSVVKHSALKWFFFEEFFGKTLKSKKKNQKLCGWIWSEGM